MSLLTPSDLNSLLNESKTNPNKLFVLDFKAVWCQPCKAIMPQLVQWSELYTTVQFYQIDVEDDEHQDTCEYFNVTAMPTFVFLKGGNVINTICGAERELILNTINQHK